MLRRRPTLTVLVICWLMLLGVATPAHAQTRGKPAARQLESLGWVIDFDLGSRAGERVGATFRYMLSYVDSDAPYDVQGTVKLGCKQHFPTEGFRCTIPDMPALILKATGGTIDLSTMELPFGTLDVCGSLNRMAGSNPLHGGLGVPLVETSSPDLYTLLLNDTQLMLTHRLSATTQPVAKASHPFHLTLEDTTLIAPRQYTLDLLPELVDHYALEELTIVDPGAFAHRLTRGTSCADDFADQEP